MSDTTYFKNIGKNACKIWDFTDYFKNADKKNMVFMNIWYKFKIAITNV